MVVVGVPINIDDEAQCTYSWALVLISFASAMFLNAHYGGCRLIFAFLFYPNVARRVSSWAPRRGLSGSDELNF